MAKQTGKPRMTAAMRSEQLRALASRRFAERGYWGVSVGEIAREAGISSQMLYNYAGSKENLYRSCFRSARERLHRVLAEGAAGGGEADERLYRAALGYFGFAVSEPDAWTILNEHRTARRGPLADEVAASRRAFGSLAGGQVNAAREHAGLAQLSDSATYAVAFTTAGAAEGMLSWWLDHPRVSREHVAARFMDVAWMGLENLRNDRLWDHSLRAGVTDGEAGPPGERPVRREATAAEPGTRFPNARLPVSPSPKRQAARAAREEEIIAVAERLFLANGYRATSMDEIAAELGVTKPMVYGYVGDKESLYLACFRRARERLETSIDAGAELGGDWQQRFRYGIAGVLGFYQRNREAWLMLQEHAFERSGPFAAEVADMRARTARIVAQHFTEARRDAGLGVSATGIELSAHAVVGSLERVACWWLEDEPGLEIEAVTEAMIGVLHHGLAHELGARRAAAPVLGRSGPS